MTMSLKRPHRDIIHPWLKSPNATRSHWKRPMVEWRHGKPQNTKNTNTRLKLVRNAETTGIGQDESIATSLKDYASSLLPTNLRHMLAKRYKQQACRGFYSLKSAGRHLACTGASGHKSNSKAVHLEIPCITLEEQMVHRYQSLETPDG